MHLRLIGEPDRLWVALWQRDMRKVFSEAFSMEAISPRRGRRTIRTLYALAPTASDALITSALHFAKPMKGLKTCGSLDAQKPDQR